MKKKSYKITISIFALLLSSALFFAACSPQLGAVSKSKRLLDSAHYKDGKFHNSVETRISTSSDKMLDSTIEALGGKQQREPEIALPSIPVAVGKIGKSEDLKVTWLGHSTCLIEVDGQVILTDPMFSDRASPFSFIGPKRFPSKLPVQINDLPPIDVVVISHDHYDHLDYQSILALKAKTSRFYVPLGVGAHLKRWDVPADKIKELDWWEEVSFNNLKFIATPARHFSGRGIQRNKTFWASWVIQGKEQRVFFGGDSGYFDGFEEIGDKYGPFDITMLESGAYNEAWSEIHMMPEETVQAHLDLLGKVLLPIHWGKFNLSIHAWNEPIERLLLKAQTMNVNVATPLIGQHVLSGADIPQKQWWSMSTDKVTRL